MSTNNSGRFDGSNHFRRVLRHRSADVGGVQRPCSSTGSLLRSRKYSTYRSGVRVQMNLAGSPKGLQKVCGVPAGP
jgi:hypothetical protein